MPVDYRILQQAPEPIKAGSLGSLARILDIGDEIQKEREAKQTAAANQVLAQLSAQYAQEPEKAIPELYRLGFTKQARELEDHVDKRKKALFEIRKAELDGDLTAGRISAEKAKAEREAMDAESPEKMAPYFAAAENDNDWQNAAALARLKFREKAEPFIAQMGAFDPAKAKFAGRVVMGPEKVAIDVDRDLTREQALTIAQGQQATTQRGQDISAETQRRGQDLTNTRAREAAAGGGGAAGLSASDKALVAAVLKQPAMFKSLTPTVKSRIGAALAEGGFQFEQQGSGSSRGVTSGDAGRIAEFDTSLDDVKVLRDTLTATKSATGTGAKIGAMLPNAVTDLTGWGTTAKQRQAVIDRVKQVIGKALEGGVLRAEDEKKYEKILPTIGDTEAVAQEKINGLEKAIKLRRERFIESLSDAGYDTSRYDAKGGTQKPGAPTAEELIKKYGG